MPVFSPQNVCRPFYRGPVDPPLDRRSWWEKMGYPSKPEFTQEQALRQFKIDIASIKSRSLTGQALVDALCSHPNPVIHIRFRRYAEIAKRRGFSPIE